MTIKLKRLLAEVAPYSRSLVLLRHAEARLLPDYSWATKMQTFDRAGNTIKIEFKQSGKIHVQSRLSRAEDARKRSLWHQQCAANRAAEAPTPITASDEPTGWGNF